LRLSKICGNDGNKDEDVDCKVAEDMEGRGMLRPPWAAEPKGMKNKYIK
jgi:hypothetical protein